jgi:hypothetical protein
MAQFVPIPVELDTDEQVENTMSMVPSLSVADKITGLE